MNLVDTQQRVSEPRTSQSASEVATPWFAKLSKNSEAKNKPWPIGLIWKSIDPRGVDEVRKRFRALACNPELSDRASREAMVSALIGAQDKYELRGDGQCATAIVASLLPLRRALESQLWP
jgi:hypothetical protein